MLGIIGRNFEGGRHTKPNFGSYWLSDLRDLWQKYDDERQVITILHVAFWMGERTIDKNYHKELDKGNFIIIVVIFALIIQNVLHFIIYLIQFTCLEGLYNIYYLENNTDLSTFML